MTGTAAESDLVDREILELAKLEIQEFVAGSFLQEAPIVPVSAKTGAGLEELKRELARLAEAAERRGRGAEAALYRDAAAMLR